MDSNRSHRTQREHHFELKRNLSEDGILEDTKQMQIQIQFAFLLTIEASARGTAWERIF